MSGMSQLFPGRGRKIDRSVLGDPKVFRAVPTDMEMYPFRVVDQFPAR